MRRRDEQLLGRRDAAIGKVLDQSAERFKAAGIEIEDQDAFAKALTAVILSTYSAGYGHGLDDASEVVAKITGS